MQEKFNLGRDVRKSWRKTFKAAFRKATKEDLTIIKQFVLLLEPDINTRSCRAEAVLDEIETMLSRAIMSNVSRHARQHAIESGYKPVKNPTGSPYGITAKEVTEASFE